MDIDNAAELRDSPAAPLLQFANEDSAFQGLDALFLRFLGEELLICNLVLHYPVRFLAHIDNILPLNNCRLF